MTLTIRLGCNRPSAHPQPLVIKAFAFAVARLKGNVLQTIVPAFRWMNLMFVISPGCFAYMGDVEVRFQNKGVFALGSLCWRTRDNAGWGDLTRTTAGICWKNQSGSAGEQLDRPKGSAAFLLRFAAHCVDPPPPLF